MATVGSMRGLHSTVLLRQTANEKGAGQKTDEQTAASVTTAKPVSTAMPPATEVKATKIPEAVLTDRHEPGWALHHATYTDEGGLLSLTNGHG